jgi:Protein of unknown function (DUF1488)
MILMEYISSREVVSFAGEELGHPVKCAVSREALDDCFGSDGRDDEGLLANFHRSRSEIEPYDMAGLVADSSSQTFSDASISTPISGTEQWVVTCWAWWPRRSLRSSKLTPETLNR